MVVPAVGIRRAGRAGGHGRSRRVELEVESGRRGVSRLVGTASAWRGAAAVGAAVGDGGGAASYPRRLVAAAAESGRAAGRAGVKVAASGRRLNRGRTRRVVP